MDLQRRIQAFVQLGHYLEGIIYQHKAEELHRAEILNPWFTKRNIAHALDAWRGQLTQDMLTAWIGPYKLDKVISSKRVLVVMAGNIPLVGFHDFLSVLISGHEVVVKMSSMDNVLLKVLIEKLISIDSEFNNSISFIDKVKDKNFDGVITTGSDNSAGHFEYYFRHTSKIIRKNRRSIAVLDGTESSIELNSLADDVFLYFGLGCRNVSKLFLPKGYDLNKLFKAFYSFNNIMENTKYSNNYDYNKAVFLMGANKLVENGFLLMKEDESLFPPVAMLYYEYYDDILAVEQFIDKNEDSLQCVVSKNRIPFGDTQKPNLWDYADGVDTVDFLRKL